MNTIDIATEIANAYPQALQVRAHSLRADLTPPDSTDSAPGPHDYFDASLLACKALTATWYARRKKIPLERVTGKVERDDHEERQGKYHLRVQLTFHGPLTDEQRQMLLKAAAACPVHKLMTTTEVDIETLME